jgi:hypothetical protein
MPTVFILSMNFFHFVVRFNDWQRAVILSWFAPDITLNCTRSRHSAHRSWLRSPRSNSSHWRLRSSSTRLNLRRSRVSPSTHRHVNQAHAWPSPTHASNRAPDTRRAHHSCRGAPRRRRAAGRRFGGAAQGGATHQCQWKIDVLDAQRARAALPQQVRHPDGPAALAPRPQRARSPYVGVWGGETCALSGKGNTCG